MCLGASSLLASCSTRPPLERFQGQVRRTPEEAALLDRAGGALTFADLETEPERVAHALRTRGIEAGSVVGLYLERSAAWVVGVLGILKANAAVMPLSPSYRLGRVRES